MTAEIAVCNRQAIVLAADSAITVGKERVWQHANKLFSLGPDNDIAIMVYNAGDFSGFPWDVIVKQFRAEKAGVKYATVKDCAEALIGFLSGERFSADELNRAVYLGIFLEFLDKMKVDLPSNGKGSEFNTALETECARLADEAQGFPSLPNAPDAGRFSRAYRDSIGGLASHVFNKKIRGALLDRVVGALYEVWHRQVCSSYFSGVVVAGYGHGQFFPELLEFVVDGKDKHLVRTWLNRHQDTNRDNERKTFIMSFGQKDIFYLFMEGISPEYTEFVEALLGRVLSEKSDRLLEPV